MYKCVLSRDQTDVSKLQKYMTHVDLHSEKIIVWSKMFDVSCVGKECRDANPSEIFSP